MTQEEKDLLLKDLCARLPYGVKGETLGSKTCTLTHLGKEGDFTADDYHGWLNSGQFIPYLRPMSSMTEEEKNEYQSLCEIHFDNDADANFIAYYFDSVESFDYLNKKMFDYRGLIPKDLALSTKEYNPYKD